MKIIDEFVCLFWGHHWVKILSKGESYRDPMKQTYMCDRCGKLTDNPNKK